jgi:hypothetical protein
VFEIAPKGDRETPCERHDSDAPQPLAGSGKALVEWLSWLPGCRRSQLHASSTRQPPASFVARLADALFNLAGAAGVGRGREAEAASSQRCETAANSYARRLLVEAAWSYRHPAKVSPAIQKRHEGLPKAIIDRAWDAQLRLCKRYRRLVARGKHPNVAVVAIARELAAFIWDIARMTSAPAGGVCQTLRPQEAAAGGRPAQRSRRTAFRQLRHCARHSDRWHAGGFSGRFNPWKGGQEESS